MSVLNYLNVGTWYSSQTQMELGRKIRSIHEYKESVACPNKATHPGKLSYYLVSLDFLTLLVRVKLFTSPQFNPQAPLLDDPHFGMYITLSLL